MTIYELARQLGVAPGTVSKALNGTGRIKAETRERIIAFAHAANYSPSEVAANLRRSKTHTIGIIVPGVGMNVFNSIVRQTEQYAAERDYNVILTTTGGSFERELECVSMLIRRRVEGVIATPFGERDTLDCAHFRRFSEAGIPMVMTEQDMPCTDFPKVMVDNRDGARQAVEYLLSLGHRRILMPVFNSYQWNRSGLDRIAGFHDAFAAYGLERDPAGIIPFTGNLPELLEIIRQRRITALFAVCDFMALQIIAGLTDAGMRIPDDISICGFDDIDPATYLRPSLTTVRQPMEQLGLDAATLLFKRIESDNPMAGNADFITVPCELIVRNSCCEPKP